MMRPTSPALNFDTIRLASDGAATAVAMQRGGERAAFIAVTVALAESGLRVLMNPNDPAGDASSESGSRP